MATLLPGVDCSPMKDEKWPALPQDPSWVLDQIEMAFRQIGPAAAGPMPVPKMNRDEIESAVTRALREELERLDSVSKPARKE